MIDINYESNRNSLYNNYLIYFLNIYFYLFIYNF